MNEAQSITGKYRHYKGGEYEIIGEATHTETNERLVVYRALYDARKIWARPYDMFFGVALVDEQETPRFTRIGE